jgi:anthranilate 1,2-dioxygenase small subunit
MIARLETLTTGALPAANELRTLTEDVRALYEDVAWHLDDDQIERFPDFFIDDCSYQVVSRENFAEGLPQATIYCDGIGMVRDRVIALRQTQVYVPRSWRHFISGVRVMAVVGEHFHVSANFLITEAMSDQDPTLFLVGQYLGILVRVEGQLKFRQHLAIYDNYHVRRSLIVPV